MAVAEEEEQMKEEGVISAPVTSEKKVTKTQLEDLVLHIFSTVNSADKTFSSDLINQIHSIANLKQENNLIIVEEDHLEDEIESASPPPAPILKKDMNSRYSMGSTRNSSAKPGVRKRPTSVPRTTATPLNKLIQLEEEKKDRQEIADRLKESRRNQHYAQLQLEKQKQQEKKERLLLLQEKKDALAKRRLAATTTASSHTSSATKPLLKEDDILTARSKRREELRESAEQKKQALLQRQQEKQLQAKNQRLQIRQQLAEQRKKIQEEKLLKKSKVVSNRLQWNPLSSAASSTEKKEPRLKAVHGVQLEEQKARTQTQFQALQQAAVELI